MVEAGQSSLKTYFENSRKWEQDAYIEVLRSRRFWRLFALLSLIICLASVVAVVSLAPLKTVEPFVIRVDNSTGIVEVMSALQDAPQTYDEAVARYFLGKYVRAHEGFVFDEREHSFRVVSLLSDDDRQTEFARFYNAQNPSSPQNLYGRRTTVAIKIRAISFINENVAQVRYVREEKIEKSVTQSQWIATMTFTFIDTNISAEDRLINPLGFVVTEYRAVQEVTR